MKEKIKEYFKNFNILDCILFCFGILSIVISSIFAKSSIVAILCSLFGVFYLIFWSKRYYIGLFFCIVFLALYIWQSAVYKNWGEVVQSCFALIVAVVLIGLWLKDKSKTNEKLVSQTTHINRVEALLVCCFTILIFVAYLFFLKYLQTPNIYLASLNLTVSTIALYFMIRKHYLMFVLFIISNILQIFIWLQPLLAGDNMAIENLPIVFSFVTFLLANIIAFVDWKKNVIINNNKSDM